MGKKRKTACVSRNSFLRADATSGANSGSKTKAKNPSSSPRSKPQTVQQDAMGGLSLKFEAPKSKAQILLAKVRSPDTSASSSTNSSSMKRKAAEGEEKADRAGGQKKKKKSKKKKGSREAGGKDRNSGSAAANPIFSNILDKVSATAHSAELASRVFEWMVHPVSTDEFYSSYSEQKPLFIARHPDSLKEHSAAEAGGKDYYQGLFDKTIVDNILRSEKVEFTKDLNITKYRNDTRTTLDPPEGGRAHAQDVWKHFDDGCSVRFLCPQRFHPPLWRLLAYLDEFWGAGAGANTYLTPAGTQGFAPHYDEVDIFVLQTEGAKRWRLYPPRDPNEVLSEVSSGNFKQSDIASKPFLDVTLRAGDFLYAPRGTIHQCEAVKDSHSMHITVSSSLKWSWAQFLRVLLPRAVEIAAAEDKAFRKALPRHFHSYMGVMHADQGDDDDGDDDDDEDEDDEEDEEEDDEEDEEKDEDGAEKKKKTAKKSNSSKSKQQQQQQLLASRAAFRAQLFGLIDKVLGDEDLLQVDSAADIMALDFMHGRVPLPLSMQQQQLTHTYNKGFAFKAGTRVRLVRAGVARMIAGQSDSTFTLLHMLRNSRRFQDNELTRIELPTKFISALNLIIGQYPSYVRVEELPLEEEEEEEEEGEGEGGGQTQRLHDEDDRTLSEVEEDKKEEKLEQCCELVDALYREGLLQLHPDDK